MPINRLRVSWLVAPVSAGLLSACSEGGSGPDGPPPPDLTTPEGTIFALTDFYNRQMSDAALGLLHPEYRFTPAQPESIPFLGQGETSWDRDQEANLVELILVPERTSWLDQVLLEVDRELKETNADGDVEITADVELGFLRVNTLQKGRSQIVMVFRRNADGDYLLYEERESLSPIPGVQRTVSQMKSQVWVSP